jgi:hypothetical protein
MMMLTTTPTTMRAAPTMRGRASRARTAAVRPAVREVRATTRDATTRRRDDDDATTTMMMKINFQKSRD